MRSKLASLLLVAAFLGTACGEASPEQQLGRAASRTEEAGSAGVGYEVSVTSAGTDEAVELVGAGATDFEARKGRIAFDISQIWPAWGRARARRIRQHTTLKEPASFAQTVTMELYDFGVEVDVAAPPAGEVVDFGELLDAAGG